MLEQEKENEVELKMENNLVDKLYSKLESIEPADAFVLINQWECAINKVRQIYSSKYTYCGGCHKYLKVAEAKTEREGDKNVTRCPECNIPWYIREVPTAKEKESAQKFLEDFLSEMEEDRRKVSSEEYISWVYDFVSVNKAADDESAFYTYKGIDAENGQLLSAFFSYVRDLAEERGIPVVLHEEFDFPEAQVTIKIKDKCFDVVLITGQGAITTISLLEDEPERFVKL